MTIGVDSYINDPMPEPLLLTYKTKIITVRWIANSLADDPEKQIVKHECEKIFEGRAAAVRFGKRLLKSEACWDNCVEIIIETRDPFNSLWRQEVIDLTPEGITQPWSFSSHSCKQPTPKLPKIVLAPKSPF